MNEHEETTVIDIRALARKLYGKRRLFLFRVWPVTFLLACLYILSIPRYYTSEVKLAPEMGGNGMSSPLGSLASSAGLDLGSLEGSDAIYPMLYPDLMEDNGFVTSLFPIQVKSEDGEINTSYYTYLKSYQKKAWWVVAIGCITKAAKSVLPQNEKKDPATGGGGEKSPYWLSEEDDALAEKIRGNVSFSIDKLTSVITITAKAQDPLVAKILADSVQAHLQQFVTDYRTNKARVDEKHYKQLYDEALTAYEKSCSEYARLSDAYSNVVLNRYRIMLGNQEKDTQLKYATLQAVGTQLQMASAKVQERTPAFTVIKGAKVPLKPAGPKRMLFVLGMLILTTFIAMFWVVREELHF